MGKRSQAYCITAFWTPVETANEVYLMLCDEATSALDSMTEAEILNVLKSLANNRTSVFIALRLTIAMQCDEIIVLEDGKVTEQGSHEVLLTKAEIYAQLWGQQNNTVDALDPAVKVGV